MVVDIISCTLLTKHLLKIEEKLDADILTIISPILHGLDIIVKDVVEATDKKEIQ